MFFTQEDYKKIEDWLSRNAIRDTDFNNAQQPFKGNEIISFVQNGHNTKAYLKDFVDQLFLLGVTDFLNVTDKFGEINIPLSKAIQLIPYRSRKIGQIITFLNEDGEWKIYQFQGKRKNQWNEESLWKDLIRLIAGSIATLPDEEDLTATNENGINVIKFKDKTYNPDNFSGKGRVFLRKNIVQVKDPQTGNVYKTNLLTQSMISKENTIYIIQYDYNLNGQTITIPEGCTIQFEGGKLVNGSIEPNGVVIINNIYSHIENIVLLSKNFSNDKNYISVYVDDFGADPTGVKYSAKAINEAIEFVSNSGGGEIHFNGTYTLETSIKLKSNITLYGHNSTINWISSNVTVDGHTGFDDYKVFGTIGENEIHYTPPFTNITIQDFISDCDNALAYFYDSANELEKASPRGVFGIANVDGLTIKNIKRHFGYDARVQPIWLIGCTNVEICDCYIERYEDSPSGDNDGIWIYSGGRDCSNFRVHDNTIIVRKDEALAFTNVLGKDKDWFPDSTKIGSMSNIKVYNNKFVCNKDASYGITYKPLANNKEGYGKDLIIYNNLFEDAGIIIRPGDSGTIDINNNIFNWNNPDRAATEGSIIQIDDSIATNIVNITSNTVNSQIQLKRRFVYMGIAKHITISSNVFTPRYGPDYFIVINGVSPSDPISIKILYNRVNANYGVSFNGTTYRSYETVISYNDFSGYGLLELANAVTYNNISIINNKVIQSLLTLGDNADVGDSFYVNGNYITSIGYESSTIPTGKYGKIHYGINYYRFSSSGKVVVNRGGFPDTVLSGYLSTLESAIDTIGQQNGIIYLYDKHMFISQEFSDLDGVPVKDSIYNTLTKRANTYYNLPQLSSDAKGYRAYVVNTACWMEWSGSRWIPQSIGVGTTSNRPVFSGEEQTAYLSYRYFDTTLKKPIWWSGSEWVDATGATV